MSTRQQMGIINLTFNADADLSSDQYFVVTAASTTRRVKRCTGGSDPTPLGILQDDNGGTIGNAVEVCPFGPCQAKVAACDQGGEACPIGHWDGLVCASGGQLMRAGSNSAINARAMDTLSSGSAILEVFFLAQGSACSVAAS